MRAAGDGAMELQNFPAFTVINDSCDASRLFVLVLFVLLLLLLHRLRDGLRARPMAIGHIVVPGGLSFLGKVKPSLCHVRHVLAVYSYRHASRNLKA
jgi:hypothetical protein